MIKRLGTTGLSECSVSGVWTGDAASGVYALDTTNSITVQSDGTNWYEVATLTLQ